MRTPIAALILLLACGNGGSPPSDAGADVTDDGLLVTVHQKGQIVDSTTGAGIPFARFGIGPFSGPTDATGSYDHALPLGQATMWGAAPDSGTSYVFTTEQTYDLLGDADRGKTTINPLLYEQSIRNALTIADQGGAMLRVLVIGIGACTDVTGATISVPNAVAPDAGPQNPGVPVIVYFDGNPAMPAESRSSVAAGITPSAIVYNLPAPYSPYTQFNQITVQHPTCKQAPFPINDPVEPNIRYTGDVYLTKDAPANQPLAASTIRVFLD